MFTRRMTIRSNPIVVESLDVRQYRRRRHRDRSLSDEGARERDLTPTPGVIVLLRPSGRHDAFSVPRIVGPTSRRC